VSPRESALFARPSIWSCAGVTAEKTASALFVIAALIDESDIVLLYLLSDEGLFFFTWKILPSLS
jgi:hypothetical protein